MSGYICHILFVSHFLHPCLPGVLCHSVKLQTSTPGYIAERACREALLDSPEYAQELVISTLANKAQHKIHSKILLLRLQYIADIGGGILH
jgi:hypothetical protein